MISLVSGSALRLASGRRPVAGGPVVVRDSAGPAASALAAGTASPSATASSGPITSQSWLGNFFTGTFGWLANLVGSVFSWLGSLVRGTNHQN